MIKNPIQQAGFTLLELLIGLTLIIIIALIGLPLVYHYCNQASQQTKVADSIKRLKEVSTIYYFNDIKQNQKPAVVIPLSMPRLYQVNLLDKDDLYNIISTNAKGKITAMLYTYTASYNYTTQLIDINLTTTNSVTLQNDSPSSFSKYTRSGKLYYSYDWQFHPLLDIYQNQQNARTVRTQRMVDGND